MSAEKRLRETLRDAFAVAASPTVTEVVVVVLESA